MTRIAILIFSLGILMFVSVALFELQIIKFEKSFKNDRYIEITLGVKKPYTVVNCWIDLPISKARRCSSGVVMENSTTLYTRDD